MARNPCSETEAEALLQKHHSPGVYKFARVNISQQYIYRKWDGVKWFVGEESSEEGVDLRAIKRALETPTHVSRHKLIESLMADRRLILVCDLGGNLVSNRRPQKQLILL